MLDPLLDWMRAHPVLLTTLFVASAVMVVLGVLGAALPSWLFLQVQPFLSDILGVSVNAGMGFWLNVLGNTLVFAISLFRVSALSRLASPVNATQ